MTPSRTVSIPPAQTRAVRVARIASMMLVPPVISAIVFSILVWQYQHGPVLHILLIWLVSLLFSGVLQILYVLYLRREERVSAYDVPERMERAKPYLVSVGVSFVGFLMLWYLHASVHLLGLMACFTLNTLVIAAINSRWKISAHMMGLTGPSVFLLPLCGWGLLAVIPLAAFLGWVRVTVGAHSTAQVIAGGILGAGLTSIELFLLLSWGYRLLPVI